MTNRFSAKARTRFGRKPLRWDREGLSDTSYAHASGRIRLLEERFLGFSDFEKLVDPQTSDSERGQILDSASYPAASGLEERVLSGRGENNRLLRELDKDGPLTRALLLDIDYHNLKSLLKHYLLAEEGLRDASTEADESLIAETKLPQAVQRVLIPDGYTDVHTIRRAILDLIAIDRVDLEAAAVAADPDEAERVPGSIDPELKRSIAKLILAWYEHPEALTLSLEADKLYFEHARLIAADPKTGSASGFLRDYFSLKADIANLQMLLRVRRFRGGEAYLKRILVSGGEVDPAKLVGLYDKSTQEIIELWHAEGGLTKELSKYIQAVEEHDDVWALGEASDNLLMRLAEHGRRQTFSADTLAGFWLSRQIEGQNLRILFSGLERGYSGESLLHLLRHVYRRDGR